MDVIPTDINLCRLLPVPLFIKDIRGRYVECNPAFEKLIDIPREQIIGRTVFELYSESSAQQYSEMDNRLFANPGVQAYETTIIDVHGIERKVLFRKATFMDATGAVAGLVGVIVDITAQKTAEREAEMARKFLDTVVNNIPHLIYVKEAATRRYVYMNRSMLGLIGIRAEDILGKTPSEALPRQAAEQVAGIEAGMMASGNTLVRDNVSVMGNTNTGGKVLRITHVPIMNERNECEYLLTISDDVTDARLQTEKTRALLRQNEQLIEAISSILVSVNAEGTVTHWNAEAEKYFAAPASKRIGKLFFKLRIKWDWNKVRHAVAFCLEHKKPVMLQELRYHRYDGQEGFLTVRLSPFPESEEKSGGFLLLAEDITRRMVMESHLLQAQKLESVGMLASGIAHEINTPAQYIGDNTRFLRQSYQMLLQLLQGYEDLFAEACRRNDNCEILDRVKSLREDADVEYLLQEIPQALDQSLDGIDRISGIIRAMKEFSHPGTGEKVAVSLNRAIESALVVCRNEWKQVAEVHTHYDALMPKVSVYPAELNQVVLNILLNAVHALQDAGCAPQRKGEISVTTRWEDGWAYIRISDTGAGIPASIRDRIFDPFFTTKPVGRGTGQGLAIAHAIVVEKHGGRLRFETEVGKGTTFIIELPSESAAEYSF